MKKLLKVASLLCATTLVACGSGAGGITAEEAQARAAEIAENQADHQITGNFTTTIEEKSEQKAGDEVSKSSDKMSIYVNRSAYVLGVEMSSETTEEGETVKEAYSQYVGFATMEDVEYCVVLADQGGEKVGTIIGAVDEEMSKDAYFDAMLDSLLEGYSDMIYGAEMLASFSELEENIDVSEELGEGATSKVSITYTSSGEGNLGVKASVKASVSGEIAEGVNLTVALNVTEELKWDNYYLANMSANMEMTTKYPKNAALGEMSGLEVKVAMEEKVSTKLSCSATLPNVADYTFEAAL